MNCGVADGGGVQGCELVRLGVLVDCGWMSANKASKQGKQRETWDCELDGKGGFWMAPRLQYISSQRRVQHHAQQQQKLLKADYRAQVPVMFRARS